MTLTADFLRDWTRAILTEFDDAITDPTGDDHD